MRKVYEKIMPPKTGLAVEVKDKQYLRITDIEGGQVVDVVIFNLHNLREKLSTAWSRQRKLPKASGKYVPSDTVTEGDYLKSTLCRPMMTIVKETAEIKGVHSIHGRMCNRWLYEIHGVDSRDGCFEIISKVVAPYSILPEDIPDAIAFNMNYVHHPDEHRWEIKEPVSKAGDYVELRAEMDCLVAISNCPEDVLSPCNLWRCKPMKIEIFEEEE
jgi:uncharacterized protein YcgI (DUF1989 family)